MFKPGTLVPNLSLLLLWSCATAHAVGSTLPADGPINQEAGRGGWLVVTLRLESGEELPFLVDTGTSGTFFDKSLEPKLGEDVAGVKKLELLVENAHEHNWANWSLWLDPTLFRESSKNTVGHP